MFLWNDPLKQGVRSEERSESRSVTGLVSARWLAVDAILRSLILDPEGPETRAMMRRDLRVMYAAGRIEDEVERPCDAYQEAAGVMNTLRKSIS
jgi:hypothetical protein